MRATSIEQLRLRAKSALALPIVAVSIMLLAGCARSNQYQPPPPPGVTVSKPLTEPVADYLLLTGSIAASETVDLVARVEGYLRRIDFKDGSLVKAGELLFLIEQEPYEAKLQSQEAQLLSAQSEYDRQLRMLKENATSRANVENWRSQRDQAAAAVTQAKINLSYTRITAPFNGRIGRRMVDVGNLVGSGAATKLATIEQLDPAYVYFSVNERDVLRVRTAARKRGLTYGHIPSIPVYLGLQTEADYPHEGTLDYVGTGLDTSSGTLQLRAVVQNPERTFMPGLFAKLRIPLAEPAPHLMVPDEVVSSDQAGSYVMVVDADRKVHQQRVVTGPDEQGMRAILSGLDANTNVVIDGLQNAVPGNLVTPVERQLTRQAAVAGQPSR